MNDTTLSWIIAIGIFVVGFFCTICIGFCSCLREENIRKEILENGLSTTATVQAYYEVRASSDNVNEPSDYVLRYSYTVNGVSYHGKEVQDGNYNYKVGDEINIDYLPYRPSTSRMSPHQQDRMTEAEKIARRTMLAALTRHPPPGRSGNAYR